MPDAIITQTSTHTYQRRRLVLYIQYVGPGSRRAAEEHNEGHKKIKAIQGNFSVLTFERPLQASG